jgi:tRNA1(Val) A37 N6-methylase TrmN6
VSSLNPYYTFEYSQPEDYKFSHDSVFLARRVYDELKTNPSQITKALDLCSGCGIVGLDLLFHLNTVSDIRQFDFLEVQSIYKNHFLENKHRLMQIQPSQTVEMQFVNINYSEALHESKFQNKYDLIVCNPPYFTPTQGKLSDNEFKNRCRFFIDSDFKTLVEFIRYSLSDTGRCFLIFHDLKDHKIDLNREIQKIAGLHLHVKHLAPIRKSIFLEIVKK